MVVSWGLLAITLTCKLNDFFFLSKANKWWWTFFETAVHTKLEQILEKFEFQGQIITYTRFPLGKDKMIRCQNYYFLPLQTGCNACIKFL